MSKTKTGTSKVDLGEPESLPACSVGIRGWSWSWCCGFVLDQPILIDLEGVSKRKQKSEVKSAPKPKRKQVKVLEPVPGVNSPAPDTVASKEPAPSSATKPKPIKGVLKSSKSSAPIEKSAASDVVKKDSKKGKASKPQPHSPSVSAANAADKKSSLKAEKKSSTIRSPASSLKQVVSEEENGTLLTGFEAESDDEEGDSSDEDTDEEGLAQTSEFDAKHLPKAIKRLRSESKNPKQNEPVRCDLDHLPFWTSTREHVY